MFRFRGIAGTEAAARACLADAPRERSKATQFDQRLAVVGEPSRNLREKVIDDEQGLLRADASVAGTAVGGGAFPSLHCKWSSYGDLYHVAGVRVKVYVSDTAHAARSRAPCAAP